jgi:hypothetical protein
MHFLIAVGRLALIWANSVNVSHPGQALHPQGSRTRRSSLSPGTPFRQRTSDLAEQKHPVRDRVTQDLIFVPPLAADAIQVAADGPRALYKIGDVEGSRCIQNLRVVQDPVADGPVQAILRHQVDRAAEELLQVLKLPRRPRSSAQGTAREPR